MNIGPSDGMLKELVKKKKIKSIKFKTKIKMNKPSDMNDDESGEAAPDDESSENESPSAGNLKADMADENEAVKTYGKRQKQHPAKKSIFSRLQKDERKHKGILSRMRP